MINLAQVTSRPASRWLTAVALLTLTLFALLTLFAWPADAKTTAALLADHQLYVNHAASGTDDGLSWDNAFSNLQDALTLAATLAPTQTVEIWVAQGVYYPDEGVGYTNNNRRHAFPLRNNVALYGGFAGGEVAREERDWNVRPTVLSGDIEQNDTVRPDGITNSPTDIVGNNSYNVVRADEVNNTAVLDGFAITAGLADTNITLGAHTGRRGGGLSLANGTLTLNNLLFQGNRAHASSGSGGGVYVFAGSLTVENVAFLYNDAFTGGALFINRHTHPSFSNFQQVVFLHNDAVYGGAFSSANGSNHIFENVVFAGNSASLDGGALYIGNDFPSFRNVIVAGNYAANNGGGYYLSSSAPRITNVTLTGNRAGNLGGAIYRESSASNLTFLHNTIIWNNEDSSGVGTPSATHGGPGAARFTVDHSLMQGMFPAGTGNLDGTDPANNPLFVQPVDPATAPTSTGDVRVLRDSPVIDRGNNQAPINGPVYPFVPLEGNVLTDLDGFERIIDGDNDTVATVDLGPYEAPLGGGLPGGDGPGGVGNSLGQTDLRLWLRTASDMSGNVATWADQSGYGHDATQANLTNQPAMLANSYNGLPALQFDGVDDFLATSAISALDTNQQTIFVVGQSGNSGLDVFLRSAYSGGTSGSTFANNHFVGLFNDGTSDVVHARSSAGGFLAGSTASSADPRLHTLQWNGDAVNYFQNGQLVDSVSGANAAPTGHIATHLGRNYENSGALNGRLAEVIIFNQTLNSAQVNLVNNYLSARYDLPLTANNFYTGSLAINGDFDWDVGGIGQESDGSHEEAHSGGLIIQNNSFLQDDGDYLLVGHDGTANEIVTADWTARRWSRVWACTKTDVATLGGTVNLIFDFSDAGMMGNPPTEPASNYQLLKRDGTSGMFTAVDTATAVIDDRVIFENVDTADLCSYLTLGALNDAPLAVQLLRLEAQADNGSLLWLALVGLLFTLTASVLMRTNGRQLSM